MKLWVKSLLSLAIIGGTAGSVIGASYAFVKLDKDEQGPAYQSRVTMLTNIDKEGTGFKAIVVKPGGDFIKDKLANVDLVEKTVNGENIDKYFDNYAKKHKGVSPDFIIQTGSMTFNNEYTNAIKPSDFIEFIKWFFKTVAWGPEISSLTTFSIVRGVDTSSNSIMLGGQEGKNHESTNIRFYPDAFFGSLPMFSILAGNGKAQDAMFSEFGQAGTVEDLSNVLKNVVPIYDKYMENSIRTNLGKKLNGITINDTDVKKAHYIFEKHLYQAGSRKINGKIIPIYKAFTHNNPELFEAIAKKYPYHLKETTGPVVERNSLGEYKIVNKKHKYMPISERIPMSEVLSLSSEFKGLGTSWLHYVSAHEYGHHQTLQAVSDFSEESVMLGSWTRQEGASYDNQAYNQRIVNMYLKSRANGLEVHGVSTLEAEKSKRDIHNYKKGIYAKFSADNGKTFETNKKIFGTDKEDYFDVQHGPMRPKYKNLLYKWLLKIGKEKAVDMPTKKIKDQIMNATFTTANDMEANQPELFKILTGLLQMEKFIEPEAIAEAIPETVKKYFEIPKPFSRGLATNEAMEKEYKGKIYKGFLLNALDNNSGTLSEGFLGKAQVFKKGAFVDADTSVASKEYSKQEQEVFDKRVKKYRVAGWETSSGGSNFKERAEKIGKNRKFTSEKTSGVFTDYTMLFPEILTRDMVQITYRPSTDPLMPGFKKHTNKFDNISEASTGFDFFIPKTLNEKWVRYRTLMLGDLGRKSQLVNSAFYWIQKGSQGDKDSIAALLAGTKIDDKTKKSLRNIIVNNHGPSTLTPEGGYSPKEASYLGKDLNMANGYLKDRFIRKSIGWSIYEDDGSQTPYNGKMLDLQNKTPKGVADAYWYYLLKSKGIGDRTLTGLWRSKVRDAVYTYGFVKKEISKKIKYLAIKSKKTGKVKYVPIHTNTDNLHYYTNQSTGTMKTLSDEGYASWTTDFFSTGIYRNATAQPGTYTMYFVDGSKKYVDGLTLGTKNIVTENGKTEMEAPTKIRKGQNGLTFTVRSQFVE